jgi:hypothetical protein
MEAGDGCVCYRPRLRTLSSNAFARVLELVFVDGLAVEAEELKLSCPKSTDKVLPL